MELTNNDFKAQNFTLTTFPTPQTFSCWKIRFKTEVCSCPNFLTEAMLWIKEVQEVNSVYDLKILCSIQKFILFLTLSYSRKDCIGPEQDFPEFLIQDKGQSG